MHDFNRHQCPVCDEETTPKTLTNVSCPRCGDFELGMRMRAYLPEVFKQKDKYPHAPARLSHAIRKRHDNGLSVLVSVVPA